MLTEEEKKALTASSCVHSASTAKLVQDLMNATNCSDVVAKEVECIVAYHMFAWHRNCNKNSPTDDTVEKLAGALEQIEFLQKQRNHLSTLIDDVNIALQGKQRKWSAIGPAQEVYDLKQAALNALPVAPSQADTLEKMLRHSETELKKARAEYEMFEMIIAGIRRELELEFEKHLDGEGIIAFASRAKSDHRKLKEKCAELKELYDNESDRHENALRNGEHWHTQAKSLEKKVTELSKAADVIAGLEKQVADYKSAVEALNNQNAALEKQVEHYNKIKATGCVILSKEEYDELVKKEEKLASSARGIFPECATKSTYTHSKRIGSTYAYNENCNCPRCSYMKNF